MSERFKGRVFQIHFYKQPHLTSNIVVKGTIQLQGFYSSFRSSEIHTLIKMRLKNRVEEWRSTQTREQISDERDRIV